MAKFQIDMRVDYSFEVEADSPEEAEQRAWEYDYQEDTSSYAGVYSIDVEEIEDDEEEEEN